jgi:hypothetical protein
MDATGGYLDLHLRFTSRQSLSVFTSHRQLLSVLPAMMLSTASWRSAWSSPGYCSDACHCRRFRLAFILSHRSVPKPKSLFTRGVQIILAGLALGVPRIGRAGQLVVIPVEFPFRWGRTHESALDQGAAWRTTACSLPPRVRWLSARHC